MKLAKLFALMALFSLLSACKTVYVPTFKEMPVSEVLHKGAEKLESLSKQTYRLKNSHWSDVAKIRNEAGRLASQVGDGKITKVQAAQHLNRYRLQLVGSNIVDDNMYEVYLRSAVDSQRGEIDREQSKAYIINALIGWQQRWDNMENKPNNPAFTNFLMETMRLQPLQ